MKDWELYLALNDPNDPIHDDIERQLNKMDKITCPISGKEIAENEGIPVMSTSGNVWIVHPSTSPFSRRTDPGGAPQTINGVPPIAGPDA